MNKDSTGKQANISGPQAEAMLIAMHVRNSMEDFHIQNLDDEQMKELNQVIRQAIFDMTTILHDPRLHKTKSKYTDQINWLERRIPEYWEVPTEVDKSSIMTNQEYNLLINSKNKI